MWSLYYKFGAIQSDITELHVCKNCNFCFSSHPFVHALFSWAARHTTMCLDSGKQNSRETGTGWNGLKVTTGAIGGKYLMDIIMLYTGHLSSKNAFQSIAGPFHTSLFKMIETYNMY